MDAKRSWDWVDFMYIRPPSSGRWNAGECGVFKIKQHICTVGEKYRR